MTLSQFLILAHCEFEFDTPGLTKRGMGEDDRWGEPYDLTNSHLHNGHRKVDTVVFQYLKLGYLEQFRGQEDSSFCAKATAVEYNFWYSGSLKTFTTVNYNIPFLKSTTRSETLVADRRKT